jgi:hypothetical protein
MASPTLHNMITIIFASLLKRSSKSRGKDREDHVPYQVLLPQLYVVQLMHAEHLGKQNWLRLFWLANGHNGQG